jgi:hypothetical protein
VALFRIGDAVSACNTHAAMYGAPSKRFMLIPASRHGTRGGGTCL